MKGLFLLGEADLASFKKKWSWFIVLGILLIILGLVAIAIAGFTTLVSVIFLGITLFFVGIGICIDAFHAWWGKWKGFTLHLIIGTVYLITGILLIKHPIFASISLTLLLGSFYLVVGIFRLFHFALIRWPNWGWGFFHGLISLILGILILSSWPALSLYIIGLFVGIDLLFLGWSYMMIGISARVLGSIKEP